MNKNLILFLTGLVVLCFVLGLLLFQEESTVQKKSKPSLIIKDSPDIVASEKKINETPDKDKEGKKSNEEVEPNSKVEKEPLPQNIEKIENINTKSTEKEVIVKKPDAEIKKSKYSFLLIFKGIDDNALPDGAEVVLHKDKNDYKNADMGDALVIPTLLLKKEKSEKFYLNLDSNKKTCFDIRVKGFGYAKDIEIPFDKEKVITIDLQKGSRIAGIITDTAVKAIPGVSLELLIEQEMGMGMSFFISFGSIAYSDESGKYQISEISPGRYKIRLKHANYLVLEQWVIFPPLGDQVVNFQMELGAQIDGLVVDQNGAPVKEVKVEMNKVPSQDMFEMDFQNLILKDGLTDSNGQFTLFGIAVGSYLITVSAKDIGHIKDFKVEIQKGEMKKNIKLMLKTSLKIKGKVVDLSSKAIENIILHISSAKTNSLMLREKPNFATTNNNGEFEFDSLDDEAYRIKLQSETYRLVNSEKLNVKAGTNDLVITVKEMMELRGVVLLPNGEKAKDYELYLNYENFKLKQTLKNVTITDNGFSCKTNVHQFGKETSKIYILAKLKGFEDCKSNLIEVKSDVDLIEDIILQLKDSTFVSFKISTIDNKAVSEIAYMATPIANRFKPHDAIEKVKLDEDHKIQIYGLQDIEYDLFLKLDGYANILIKYKRNDNTELLEIIFSKGSTVKGVAYDVNGRPIAYQKLNLKRVDILSMSLMLHLSYTAYTNEKGEFVFEQVSLGDYRLKKINPDKGFNPMDMLNITEGESVKIVKDQEVIVNIGSKEEEILLQISGQLFLDDKILDKSASVFIIGGASAMTDITKMISTDQEGKFVITQIKPGKYNLMIGLGGLGKEEYESYPIEVVINKENHFVVNLYSEKVSGIANSINGEKLKGTVSVYRAGFLNSQLKAFDSFTKALYSTTFENGTFSVKIPKVDAVDIYFTFNDKKYSAVYFQNITRDELLKKNWIIVVPQSIVRELNVIDEAGKKVTPFDCLVCDDKGISLLADLRDFDNNSDAPKEEIYLPPGKDCALFVSATDYSVSKQIVLKNSIEPITIILKVGFELTVTTKGRDNDLVELFDENKKSYVRPTSKDNMIVTHLGGGNSNVAKEGKKTFKNLLPGKYFVKLTDEKGGNEVWSELIEITDKNREVEIR